MLIQDYLDICDPVLTFDRFMGEIELEKYLKNMLKPLMRFLVLRLLQAGAAKFLTQKRRSATTMLITQLLQRHLEHTTHQQTA